MIPLIKEGHKYLVFTPLTGEPNRVKAAIESASGAIVDVVGLRGITSTQFFEVL